MVRCVNVNVVEVEQNAGAGPVCRLDKELPLGEFRMLKSQIGGNIFDQQLATEVGLNGIDIVRDGSESFFGERQWKKVVAMSTPGRAPAQMFGNEARVYGIDQRPQRPGRIR